MEYAIEYLENGYVIKANGELYIDQPYDPDKPFIDGVPQPFDSPEAAQAHAEAMLLILQ